MTLAGRTRLLVIASLLIAVTTIATSALVAAPPGMRSPQWHLDIEHALDAIGVTPGMVVGEAGAGDGYFTLPMARRIGTTGAVVANDISRRSLADLERNAKRDGLAHVQTIVGDVDDPRFPRHDLELVVIVHAFHDFSQPVEWLVNLKKYLRPGARVAIIDRDPARGAESHFWPRERISGYARDAGYLMVSAADADTDHLIMVFAPKSS